MVANLKNADYEECDAEIPKRYPNSIKQKMSFSGKNLDFFITP